MPSFAPWRTNAPTPAKTPARETDAVTFTGILSRERAPVELSNTFKLLSNL